MSREAGSWPVAPLYSVQNISLEPSKHRYFLGALFSQRKTETTQALKLMGLSVILKQDTQVHTKSILTLPIILHQPFENQFSCTGE